MYIAIVVQDGKTLGKHQIVNDGIGKGQPIPSGLRRPRAATIRHAMMGPSLLLSLPALFFLAPLFFFSSPRRPTTLIRFGTLPLFAVTLAALAAAVIQFTGARSRTLSPRTGASGKVALKAA